MERRTRSQTSDHMYYYDYQSQKKLKRLVPKHPRVPPLDILQVMDKTSTELSRDTTLDVLAVNPSTSVDSSIALAGTKIATAKKVTEAHPEISMKRAVESTYFQGTEDEYNKALLRLVKKPTGDVSKIMGSKNIHFEENQGKDMTTEEKSKAFNVIVKYPNITPENALKATHGQYRNQKFKANVLKTLNENPSYSYEYVYEQVEQFYAHHALKKNYPNITPENALKASKANFKDQKYRENVLKIMDKKPEYTLDNAIELLDKFYGEHAQSKYKDFDYSRFPSVSQEKIHEILKVIGRKDTNVLYKTLSLVEENPELDASAAVIKAKREIKIDKVVSKYPAISREKVSRLSLYANQDVVDEKDFYELANRYPTFPPNDLAKLYEIKDVMVQKLVATIAEQYELDVPDIMTSVERLYRGGNYPMLDKVDDKTLNRYHNSKLNPALVLAYNHNVINKYLQTDGNFLIMGYINDITHKKEYRVINKINIGFVMEMFLKVVFDEMETDEDYPGFFEKEYSLILLDFKRVTETQQKVRGTDSGFFPFFVKQHEEWMSKYGLFHHVKM